MVIGSSALLAILFGEPGGEQLARSIQADPIRTISAFSALEATVVAEARKGPHAGRELDLLIHRFRIQIVPLDLPQLEQAQRVWQGESSGEG